MAPAEQQQTRQAPTGLVGLLRNIGPGVIVSGSVVGSGELLVTTRMGAQVGFVFLWGVIIACLVKFFIQRELGRLCILHNDTTIQILDRVPGLRLGNTSWVAWLCFLGYFSVSIAVIGILGSVAGLMVAVFPALSYNVWAFIIFLVLSVLLYRGLYNDLETMVTVLVATFSLIVIGSVLLLQGTPNAIAASQLASGFRFGLPPEGAYIAMAVMGSVGATAVELFMYPYWIKEKGYPNFVGPQEDTPEWHQRYRGWMRVLTTDALVCTGIALLITCAYYLLGAAILKKLNVLPEGMQVVEQVSLIFTETIGSWAKSLFMFGGFCTLFSTLLVFAASSSRIAVDFAHQLGVKKLIDRTTRLRWIRALQLAFPLFWLLFILVQPAALDFVLKGANFNNLLLIPLAYAILHRSLLVNNSVGMSKRSSIALVITILIVVAFTIVSTILDMGH